MLLHVFRIYVPYHYQIRSRPLLSQNSTRSRLLQVPQRLEHAVARKQSLRRIEFHDLAVLENQDPVKVGHRLEPVRHDNDGPVTKFRPDELVYKGFGLAVEAVEIVSS